MKHVLDINVPRSRQFRVELALDRDLPPPGRRLPARRFPA
jgi:hypothetical protein